LGYDVAGEIVHRLGGGKISSANVILEGLLSDIAVKFGENDFNPVKLADRF